MTQTMNGVGLVPPILPAYVTTAGASVVATGVQPRPELVQAIDRGVDECAALTEQALRFPYPRDPKLPFWRSSTINGVTQALRSLVGMYKDDRTLSQADDITRYTAFGPLTSAVERALVRHRLRGDEGGAPVLEIGAGQRLVAAGLKAIHGNAIFLHEVSPAYAQLQGAIDVMMPAAGIDHAWVPKDYFELIYSYYGSMYGDDQIQILDKVVSGLKVGGEALVMWKFGWKHNYWAELIRRQSAYLQQNGLDISIHSDGVSISGGLIEALHAVWVRKRSDQVDVSSLFERVETRDQQKVALAPATMRLSSDGPYFPVGDLSLGDLEIVVDRMVLAACEVMRMEPRVVEESLRIQASNQCGRNRMKSGTALAGEILHRARMGSMWSSTPSRLENHEPLSFAVLDFLHRAHPALCEVTSMMRDEARMITYRANLRH